MNAHNAVPPFTSKAVSLILGLSLVLMLGSSLWQRLQNPSLIRQAQSRAVNPEEAAQQEEAIRISALMEKVKKNPKDADALIGLSEHFMTHESWDEALSFARRAQEAAPQNARPLYLAGVILHNQSKHAEAAQSLEQVLTLENDPSARYSLAVLYIHFLKQPEKGLAHAKAGLADPKTPAELKPRFQEEIENSTKHGQK